MAAGFGGASSARVGSTGPSEHAVESVEVGIPDTANTDVDETPSEWALELDSPREWGEPEPQGDLRLSAGWHVAIVTLGLAVSVASAVCMAFDGNTKGLLCMAMAPFGALLRWALSLGNPLTAPFPLLTLVAN